MTRFVFAFRCFFAILFKRQLPEDVAREFGFTRAARPAPPALSASDGALQMLSILQRDARLVDFVMEDLAPYSDEQVGAAVRGVHDGCRETLSRYVRLSPVLDAVEGTYAKAEALSAEAVKWIGNVPAQPPPGGVLRHKGWRAETVDLPAMPPNRNARIIAPAELEVE
ncbi:MAG: DUF2760 domain-containing protein [Bryobacteraceae bacterium]